MQTRIPTACAIPMDNTRVLNEIPLARCMELMAKALATVQRGSNDSCCCCVVKPWPTLHCGEEGWRRSEWGFSSVPLAVRSAQVAGFCWPSLIHVDEAAEEVDGMERGGKAKDNGGNGRYACRNTACMLAASWQRATGWNSRDRCSCLQKNRP
jgi:hypothetical protein